MKTWLITGASRGLGLVIARAALKNGDNVIATARRPENLSELNDIADGRLLSVKLELNDPESINEAVRSGLEAFGDLNVLVNNAGYGQLGFLRRLMQMPLKLKWLSTFWVRLMLPVQFCPLCVMPEAVISSISLP